MSWLALSAIFVSEWARAVGECGGVSSGRCFPWSKASWRQAGRPGARVARLRGRRCLHSTEGRAAVGEGFGRRWGWDLRRFGGAGEGGASVVAAGVPPVRAFVAAVLAVVSLLFLGVPLGRARLWDRSCSSSSAVSLLGHCGMSLILFYLCLILSVCVAMLRVRLPALYLDYATRLCFCSAAASVRFSLSFVYFSDLLRNW